jgi:hypothetical protein
LYIRALSILFSLNEINTSFSLPAFPCIEICINCFVSGFCLFLLCAYS